MHRLILIRYVEQTFMHLSMAAGWPGQCFDRLRCLCLLSKLAGGACGGGCILGCHCRIRCNDWGTSSSHDTSARKTAVPCIGHCVAWKLFVRGPQVIACV
jgi:hypothetical protein